MNISPKYKSEQILKCRKTQRYYRWFPKWDDEGKFMDRKTMRRYSMYIEWI